MKRAVVIAVAAVGAFLTGLGVVHVAMLAFVRTGSQLKVPEVVGLQVDQARSTLDGQGFVGVIERQEHTAEFGSGVVLEQRPLGGDLLRKGRKVWLTVSLGVREAAIPNLVELTYRQADIVLAREGLARGATTRVHHAGVPRGSVIAQDPPAGAKGAEGASVNLLVSLGPAPEAFVLPDLTGRPSREVESLLASRGVRVGTRTVLIDPRVLPATVLEQDPPPGSRIESGGEVDLVVSSRR